MKTMWSSLSLAWNFLTIIPLPFSRQSHVNPQMLAASFGWYPFVGFLLGTILVMSDRLLLSVLSEPMTNMLLLTILVVVTGGLHLDGLADTIDGLAGGKDSTHRLAIMRDSQVGAIGATGLILAIGLRYAGLSSLPPGGRESLLFCLPALGRWSMVVGSWKVSYPRPEGGVASAFIQYISVRDVIMATMILAMAKLPLPGASAPRFIKLTAALFLPRFHMGQVRPTKCMVAIAMLFQVAKPFLGFL
mgnify:CR=1 FL=1